MEQHEIYVILSTRPEERYQVLQTMEGSLFMPLIFSWYLPWRYQFQKRATHLQA